MNPWTAVAGVIIKEVTEALGRVAEGTQEDLGEYAEVLTAAAITAAEQGDELSLASIQRTTRMLSAKAKITARDGVWETVEGVALSIIRVGVLSVTAFTA